MTTIFEDITTKHAKVPPAIISRNGTSGIALKPSTVAEGKKMAAYITLPSNPEMTFCLAENTAPFAFAKVEL